MADFYFKDSNLTDTAILRRSDNLIGWTIETPARWFHTERTTIKGPDREPIGFIELHDFHSNVVEIRGQSFLPHRAKETSIISNSKEFQASDGQTYKWKVRKGVWELLTQDGTRTPVARLEKNGNISVYPQAMHILDEVIVTLVYMRQLKKKNDQLVVD
ncbi:hypothetical protein GYMLUDRAFT_256221, partial [Collybiopsis luxurians FD-317 M1]